MYSDNRMECALYFLLDRALQHNSFETYRLSPKGDVLWQVIPDRPGESRVALVRADDKEWHPYRCAKDGCAKLRGKRLELSSEHTMTWYKSSEHSSSLPTVPPKGIRNLL